MLNLSDRPWKPFDLIAIFTVKATSSSIDKIKLLQRDGDYPYITRSEVSNGINCFVCKQQSYSLDNGNSITVGLDTQTAFYQGKAFYTGQNIQLLRSPHLNKVNAMFLLPLLRQTLSVFSWGSNGATLTRLRRCKILLPVTPKGAPDYAFMEAYIKEREAHLLQIYRTRQTASATEPLKLPPPNCWSTFALTDIFEIRPGKRLTKQNMKQGNTPFIGASDANNGVTAFIRNRNASEDSNVLGVNYNGSVVENFYHPYTCLFSDDVKRFKLKGRKGNQWHYLFLKTILLQQKNKYTYGYKFNESRMVKQRLLLPATPDGFPDWNFMECYGKSLEARLKCTYLKRLKVRNGGLEV